MSKPNKYEVIDLTSLDCSTYDLPIIINDEVIDLVNESFDSAVSQCTDNKINKSAAQDSKKKTIKRTEQGKSIGHCSICWDKLGNKPLASTKCGHVYCLICLEKSLKCNKRCPTCRCILKGAYAYHPLYLELD